MWNVVFDRLQGYWHGSEAEEIHTKVWAFGWFLVHLVRKEDHIDLLRKDVVKLPEEGRYLFQSTIPGAIFDIKYIYRNQKQYEAYYQAKQNMKEESKKNSKKENSLEKDNDSNFPVIDIIVSNTYLKLVYYHDILRYGFMNMSTLPDSQAIVVPNALYIVWIDNGRLTS